MSNNNNRKNNLTSILLMALAVPTIGVIAATTTTTTMMYAQAAPSQFCYNDLDANAQPSGTHCGTANECHQARNEAFKTNNPTETGIYGFSICKAVK